MWHNVWIPNDYPIDSQNARLRQEQLREVYTRGRFGLNALTHLLAESCFFRDNVTPEEMALSNNAKKILGHMGIWVPGNEEAIVNALTSIPPIFAGTED